ncbi:MAG TPA: helix-turn-helix domain-containing protein [Oscillospiraceae bacterium]|nr:helix-turn-helix domain-containing protein [Oscillospiraceae bacterium]
MGNDFYNRVKAALDSNNLKPYHKNTLRVVIHHLDGMSSPEIAKKLDITLRTVQRHLKKYHELGEDIIQELCAKGNKHKLTPEQKAKLDTNIKEGAYQSGYMVNTWTARILAQHIKKQFDVVLNIESCRQLLQKIDNPSDDNYEKSDIPPHDNTWAFLEIFLGYYRSTGKYHIGKAKCYPSDFLKSEDEILKENIDLNTPVAKWYLLLAENKQTGERRHEIVLSNTTNRLNHNRGFLRKIIKGTRPNDVLLLLTNNALNRTLVRRMRYKNRAREIRVKFFRLNNDKSLDQFREDLLRDFDLLNKENQRKKIKETTIHRIEQYLTQQR